MQEAVEFVCSKWVNHSVALATCTKRYEVVKYLCAEELDLLHKWLSSLEYFR
jgi:hypothetical protein